MSITTYRLPYVFALVLLASKAANGQRYEGDTCTDSKEKPGVCSTLTNCPSVYKELLAGSPPGKLCGFSNFDPIVCCPTSNNIAEATEGSPSNVETDNSRGAIASAKCAEYASSVYAVKLPPTLSGNRKPVNVSLCAVKVPKLIVGGKKASPKEFPHMTAIGYNNPEGGILWLCGGSLISDKFVLSAAHCTYSSSWGRAAWARVGDLNLESSRDEAKPQDRRIIERIKHPDYKRPSEYHDICLFRLDQPVRFDEWARPACLPTTFPEINVSKDLAIATGWGRVDWADEEGSNDLLKVTLKLVDQPTCDNKFGTRDEKLQFGIVDEWQVCAGEEGKDTCQGDSGGPLFIYNQDHKCMYTIVGITSVGKVCGSIIPGVYTRVYHYVPWIESVVWPDG